MKKKSEICVIDGCSKPDAGRRGWCAKHYHRWWRHGHPLHTKLPVIDMTPTERVEYHSEAVTESGCWIWMGSVKQGGMGYGQSVNGTYAHREAYTAFYGEIPKGLCVLHRCDMPLCVNPKHLFIGTKLENMQDCQRKGRYAYQNKNR